MVEVILRRTALSTVSVEDAASLVTRVHNGKVLHQGGNHLLIDIDLAEIPSLASELVGWVMSQQGPRTPVPDAKLKIKQPKE